MRWTILVLCVALAGCSDGKTDDGTDDPFDDIDAGPVASDKGVIRGVVIDGALNPISGVRVAIQNSDLSVETEADGIFIFKDLEPGLYFLMVSKAGFAEVQQSTEVVAGVSSPPIVKVQVSRLPGTEPFILKDHYQGYIACEYQYVFLLDSCDGGSGLFGEPDSAIYFAVDARQPDWVQMEIMWTHTQEFGKSLTMTMGACGDTYCSPYNDNMLCQNWGPELLWCKVGKNESTRSGYGSNYVIGDTELGQGASNGIALDMSADCTVCTPPETPVCGPACGVGLIIEQDFDAFLNVFYNFVPDPDWFFTTDGDHPLPGEG